MMPCAVCAVPPPREATEFARTGGQAHVGVVGAQQEAVFRASMIELGVLAGLEVLRSLNDLNVRTKHPIELANWTNEEGSRFAPAMVASGVFAGPFTVTTPEIFDVALIPPG